MELDKTRIEDAIVREVADGIMHEDELRERVKRAVDDRINGLFAAIVDEQIKSSVEAAVACGLDHEYTRVDSFGRRVGEATTVRAELERMISGYWTEKVGRNGKPTTSNYDAVTRAEWTMTQMVAGNFSEDMHQHMVNLGGVLKDRLRTELRGTLDRLLSEVFHVQSNGDKELGKPGRACIDPPQTPVSA